MEDWDAAPLPSARGLPPRPGSSASVEAVLSNGISSGQQTAAGSFSLPTAASLRRQRTGTSVANDAGYLTAEEPDQAPPGAVAEPLPLVLRTAPSARHSAAVTASGAAGPTVGPAPRGQPHLGLIEAAAALLSESIAETAAPAGAGAGPGAGTGVGGADGGGDVGVGGGGDTRRPPSSSGPRAPPPVSLDQALEEVRSVRPSETQVEQLGVGEEGKGDREEERDSSFSTHHALVSVACVAAGHVTDLFLGSPRKPLRVSNSGARYCSPPEPPAVGRHCHCHCGRCTFSAVCDQPLHCPVLRILPAPPCPPRRSRAPASCPPSRAPATPTWRCLAGCPPCR